MGYGDQCDGCGKDQISLQICSKCFDRLIVAIKNDVKDKKGRYDITAVEDYLLKKERN